MRERISVVFQNHGGPRDADFVDRWHQLRAEARRLRLLVIHEAIWDHHPPAEAPPPGAEGSVAEQPADEAWRCPRRVR
jgi:hypothetical protein